MDEMIGLKAHVVRLVDHHKGWGSLAILACRQVRTVGNNLIADVQHVGSTSVPGLPAKPILDLAAAVDTVDVIPVLIDRFVAFGFIYCGDWADTGGHLFVWESTPGIRSIHLHVVTSDDVQWKNYLRFRDILRQDAILRSRYAALKHHLKEKFPNDRPSYTDAKKDFIQNVLNKRTATRVNAGGSQKRAAGNFMSDDQTRSQVPADRWGKGCPCVK